MTRTMRTAAGMFPLVEAYLRRELTKKAFCARHAVPESVLTYWVCKYNRERGSGTGDSFVEITPGGALAERALMEVIFPNGIRLRLFSPATSQSVERLLASPSA